MVGGSETSSPAGAAAVVPPTPQAVLERLHGACLHAQPTVQQLAWHTAPHGHATCLRKQVVQALKCTGSAGVVM